MSFDGGTANVTQWGRVWYTVPAQDACPYCPEPLVYIAGKHDDNYVIVSVQADGTLAWAHKACAVLRSGRPTVSSSTPRHMPPCAMCGQPYRTGHSFSEDGATCAVDLVNGEYVSWYVPSAPVRSRHWPYPMLTAAEFALERGYGPIPVALREVA